MSTIILGGGIAGLSLGSFLNDSSTILEKEAQIGGLSRSFSFNQIAYDVGPHIMFSKNKAILDFHTSLVATNTVRRSNQIFHGGRLIKYPFENDLGKLDAPERDYCLTEFLQNPYESYEAKNMLQFFLKTFGEGITRTYLQPYNEKIWKFDPAFLDTQMVERIPKPPKEDVIKSASGIETEGYTHQLFFHYPKQGGFQQLVDAYALRGKAKVKIVNPVKIDKIKKTQQGWTITSDRAISPPNGSSTACRFTIFSAVSRLRRRSRIRSPSSSTIPSTSSSCRQSAISSETTSPSILPTRTSSFTAFPD